MWWWRMVTVMMVIEIDAYKSLFDRGAWRRAHWRWRKCKRGIWWLGHCGSHWDQMIGETCDWVGWLVGWFVDYGIGVVVWCVFLFPSMKVFGDLRSCFSFIGETTECPLRLFHYGCMCLWCGTWKVVRCGGQSFDFYFDFWKIFLMGELGVWLSVVPCDSLSRLLWLLFGCVVWLVAWSVSVWSLLWERPLTCHKAWEKVTSKKNKVTSLLFLSYLSVALSHWPFSAHHVRGALCVTRLAEIRLLCGLLAGPIEENHCAKFSDKIRFTMLNECSKKCRLAIVRKTLAVLGWPHGVPI